MPVMSVFSTILPVDVTLPALSAALARGRNAVLQAPPGAGKTTRVPLALLTAPWLQGRRIVMLEPRRIAARTAAHYMAAQLGEQPGAPVVSDSGWARAPRFDPMSGMTRLVTTRVSRASADQRRGRAGRLGPGVCFRLWREGAHDRLAEINRPAITEAALA